MELRLMGGAFSNPSLSRKKKALSKNVYCLICVSNARKLIHAYGTMTLNILKVTNLKNKNYFSKADWLKLGIIVSALMRALNNKKNDQ